MVYHTVLHLIYSRVGISPDFPKPLQCYKEEISPQAKDSILKREKSPIQKITCEFLMKKYKSNIKYNKKTSKGKSAGAGGIGKVDFENGKYWNLKRGYGSANKLPESYKLFKNMDKKCHSFVCKDSSYANKIDKNITDGDKLKHGVQDFHIRDADTAGCKNRTKLPQKKVVLYNCINHQKYTYKPPDMNYDPYSSYKDK